MNYKDRMTWLFFLLIVSGCRQEPYRDKLIKYLNDPKNKITQQIKIGETTATVRWLSDEERKLKKDTATDTDGYRYFKVVLEKPADGKFDKEKIMYLNFDIQNDFVLVEKGDSLMPTICQRIENGRAGSYEYLVVFSKSRPEEHDEEFTLIYKDKIFSTGVLAFVYKKEDIKKIPKQKIKG